MTETKDITPGIDDNKDNEVSQAEFDDMIEELLQTENKEKLIQWFKEEINSVNHENLKNSLFYAFKYNITQSKNNNIQDILLSSFINLFPVPIPTTNQQILNWLKDSIYADYTKFNTFAPRLIDLWYLITYEHMSSFRYVTEEMITKNKNIISYLKDKKFPLIGKNISESLFMGTSIDYNPEKLQQMLDLNKDVYKNFWVSCTTLKEIVQLMECMTQNPSFMDVLWQIKKDFQISPLSIEEIYQNTSISLDQVKNLKTYESKLHSFWYVIQTYADIRQTRYLDQDDLDMYSNIEQDLKKLGISLPLLQVSFIVSNDAINISEQTVKNALKYKEKLRTYWINIDMYNISQCTQLTDETFSRLEQLWISSTNLGDMLKYSSIKTQWVNKEMIDRFNNQMYFGHFDELFGTPWASDLYKYLKKFPSTLSLNWKVLTNIHLSVECSEQKIISFFRGILEMIKSRSDITLPDSNLSVQNPEQRKTQRTNIITQYQTFLNQKIALDFTTNSTNNNRIEKKEQTFDQIFFCGATQDYSEKNQVINNGEITYINWEDWNGAYQNIHELSDWLQQFTKKKSFSNLSSKYDAHWVLHSLDPEKVIAKIQTYIKNPWNKSKKILLYLWYHWATDWSADPFSKEHFLRLAKISPNIHIIAERCDFWYAYDNVLDIKDQDNEDYIYNLKSSVSWFSNKHNSTSAYRWYLLEGFNQWMWFHEAELYARTKYTDWFTPLTHIYEYRDPITNEIIKKPVWIAYQETRNSVSDKT